MTKQAVNQEAAYRYLFAGNARFTLKGTSTFVYQMTRLKNDDGSWGSMYYVDVVLKGGKLGRVGVVSAKSAKVRAPKFQPRKLGCKGAFSGVVAVFEQTVSALAAGEASPAKVIHNGRCGCCGAELSSKESLARGIGRECNQVVS